MNVCKVYYVTANIWFIICIYSAGLFVVILPSKDRVSDCEIQ